ncbi:MAG: hypothetical protein JWN14_3730 [Chthonomonadales bacterium]|nr:hypothetical protein [Chthonomonadales bacterium]
MRCGCILVAVAILLIMLGIEGIHEAHAYSKPIDITVEQFMKSPPTEGWYRIKGCEFEVIDSVYIVTKYLPKNRSSVKKDGDSEDTSDSGTAGKIEKKDNNSDQTDGSDQHPAKDAEATTGKSPAESDSEPPSKKKAKPGDTKEKAGKSGKGDAKGDKVAADKSSDDGATGDPAASKDTKSDETPDDGTDIREVYIPVHCESMWNEKTDSFPPTDLVIQTSDPQVLEMVNYLKHSDKKTPEEMAKWLTDNKDKLVIHKDIVGMVQAGFNADKETRDLIAKDQEAVAPGYQIVEEGRKPSMMGGVGLLFGGIFMSLLSLVYWGSYLFRWKQRLA